MEFERNLPDWFEGWVEYMSASEAPSIYNKWVAVAMIGAALERKVYIDWDRRLYPNFYIILVGPPGSRKGTAMSPGRRVLEEINIKIAADATTRVKLIARLREASDNFEAIDGQIHSYAAMTIFSEELSVFLSHDDVDLIQALANWWDCPNTWKYETKHQGVDHIDGVFVNLIGATTPDLLKESIPNETFGGGLNSRIIYVYAEGREKIVIFPFEQENRKDLEEKLIQDLQVIRLTSGEAKVDETFKSRWKEWYPVQHTLFEDADPRLAFYVDRRPTHLLKLSIVFNVSRGGGLRLTSEDFDRSLQLLEETERKMAKTFAGVGKSSIADLMNKILKEVYTKGRVTYSELLRKFYYDADDTVMATAIATLEKSRLILLERLDRKEGDSFTDYLITYRKD